LGSWDLHLVEHESGIVDSVQAKFDTHILDHDSWARFHTLVSNLDQECIHAFIFTFDDRLGKHNGPVSVTSTIGDPVFLGRCCRGLDCECLRCLVEDCGGLHLGCIISIAELSETEAAHIGQGINLVHEGQMSIGVQSHEGSSEQVELDGELGGHSSFDVGELLVAGEQIDGIIVKVEDGEQLVFADDLQSLIGELPLLIEGEVVLRLEYWVRSHQLLPFISLFQFVSKKHVFDVCRDLRVEVS